MIIIRCTVPEIWSLRDRICCYFGPLFRFLPFTPLTSRKIKILKKWKKKRPADIIILQMCTINDHNVMYGSWDMEHNRQFFLPFWTIFCPFIQQVTTEKNTRRYHHFTQVHQKSWSYAILFILTYGVWECNFYFSFWTIFCPFTPLIRE